MIINYTNERTDQAGGSVRGAAWDGQLPGVEEAEQIGFSGDMSPDYRHRARGERVGTDSAARLSVLAAAVMAARKAGAGTTMLPSRNQP